MSRKIEIVSKYSSMVEEESYIKPHRATRGSAGYDFYNLTGKDITIEPKCVSEAIPLFHKVKMNYDEVFKLFPRSSFGFKMKTVLVNTVGIIDSDYYNNESNEGELLVKFINHGDEPMTIPKGTALVQGIFENYFLTEDDDGVVGESRSGGIGSTT